MSLDDEKQPAAAIESDKELGFAVSIMLIALACIFLFVLVVVLMEDRSKKSPAPK